MAGAYKPSLNWLFVFIPVSLALERMHVAPPLLFFSAALAIVPIARMIVVSTEQLATRTGDAIGGLLNATFGNAPELIIALVALRAGFFDMVRASIIGAILANVLLATGVAFLLGGLRFHTQEYNAGAARLYSSMMLISAVSLGVPSAFNRFLSPDGTLHDEKLVNLGTAVLLLAAYGLYLLFLLKTHPDFFQSATERAEEHHEGPAWTLSRQRHATARSGSTMSSTAPRFPRRRSRPRSKRFEPSSITGSVKCSCPRRFWPWTLRSILAGSCSAASPARSRSCS